MLILCRRARERIIIGENQEVFITVIKVEGGKVWLGVDADKGVPIHREEIFIKILETRRAESREEEGSE